LIVNNNDKVKTNASCLIINFSDYHNIFVIVLWNGSVFVCRHWFFSTNGFDKLFF